MPTFGRCWKERFGNANTELGRMTVRPDKGVTTMGQLTRQDFLTAQTATAKRATCGDCGTKEGQLHILGCDMESCPFCGNQLISCQCGCKKLGISPSSWAYPLGRTEAQQEDWEKLLNDKGRIPFIL